MQLFLALGKVRMDVGRNRRNPLVEMRIGEGAGKSGDRGIISNTQKV